MLREETEMGGEEIMATYKHRKIEVSDGPSNYLLGLL